MKQATQPVVALPINKDDLATNKEIRTMSSRSRETIKIPVSKVTVRPGHNERSQYNEGFSEESLLALGISIANMGLQTPIGVDILLDGTAIIQYGERRYRAHKLMAEKLEQGAVEGIDEDKIGKYDFSHIEAFIMPKTYTEQERTIAMIVENQQVPLTPLEEGAACQRLIDSGMTAAKISRLVPNWNTMRISLRLALHALTDFEKDLIRAGSLSETAAVQLSKKIKNVDERIAHIKEQMANGGKVKVVAVEQIGKAPEPAPVAPKAEPKAEPVKPATTTPAPLTDEEFDKITKSGENDEDNLDEDDTTNGVPTEKDPDTDVQAEDDLHEDELDNTDEENDIDEDEENEDVALVPITDTDALKAPAVTPVTLKPTPAQVDHHNPIDVVTKAINVSKAFFAETEGHLTPKAETLLFDIDVLLADLKAMLTPKH